MYNLYVNNANPIQSEMRLDSITTIQSRSTCFPGIKHWLIHVFPNTKHLILSYDFVSEGPPSNVRESVQKFVQYFRAKPTTTDCIYSSEIEVIL